MSRPSVGARHDDLYPQKKKRVAVPRGGGFDEQDDLFSIFTLSSAACVCHQPDNSRTPARVAAKRRQHFPQDLWPNPSDNFSHRKKIRTNRLFPFRICLRKSRTTLCLRTPDSGIVFFKTAGHFRDPAEKGRHWWFLNIKESAPESKRAVFSERVPLLFVKSHRQTPTGSLVWFVSCSFSGRCLFVQKQ